MLNVYLFMQPGTGVAPPMMHRRERALLMLRDELLRLGDLCVSPSPQHADLQVEILNLVGIDEGTGGRGLHRPDQGAGRRRVLIVRVWKATERFDLVCSDGPGNVSAERQAARRIHASADLQLGTHRYDPMLTHPC
jgi:hypothetical protein